MFKKKDSYTDLIIYPFHSPFYSSKRLRVFRGVPQSRGTMLLCKGILSYPQLHTLLPNCHLAVLSRSKPIFKVLTMTDLPCQKFLSAQKLLALLLHSIGRRSVATVPSILRGSTAWQSGVLRWGRTEVNRME